MCECDVFSLENSIKNIFHFQNLDSCRKKLNPINFPHESNIYSTNFVVWHTDGFCLHKYNELRVCLKLYRILYEFENVDEVHWISIVHFVRWHIDFNFLSPMWIKWNDIIDTFDGYIENRYINCVAIKLSDLREKINVILACMHARKWIIHSVFIVFSHVWFSDES